MSDKSFGDHMSRGVVKNPLLSTAVTGLSIEDLTQNAVLLPVSRNQELFGRQEPERTLAQDTPSPSGDATFAPINPPFTPIHPPQNAKKDDFDVNEYFARLQGTTYVSAPINSHLENANSSIEKEENLEEINLNEPIEDIQQISTGITADIAQNFSQLPTVLPQVASAVFSSFSNMLSMKSREHTPEKRVTPAQGVPLMGVSEREVAPPLMGASEREVGPPPREPPIAGPGNFRLTTKKKYAQIPGLSSGETAQMPTYTAPTISQPIFTPPQPDFNNDFTNETNIPTFDVGQTNANNNVFSNTSTIPKLDDRPNVYETPKPELNFVATIPQESNQQAIIPPPPMFSNLAKRDSSPNVGKTILPPSVARRIGSNKPSINNQAPAFATVGNIFVPPPVEDTSSVPTPSAPFIPTFQSNPTMATSYASQESSQPSTAMPPINTVPSAVNAPFASPAIPHVLESTSQIVSSINMPPANTSSAMPPFKTENLPSPPKSAFTPPTTMTPHANMSSITSATSVVPPPMYPERTPNIPPTANIPPFANIAPVPTTSTSVVTTLLQTNLYLQDQPPSVLQPETSAQNVQIQASSAPAQHVSILSQNISEEQLCQMFDIPSAAEPPKIPQPPKPSGSTNFRMTKKRPQYYSGPIEGVGAISNNIKPTLTPAAPAAFQGAVFTPELNTGHQAAVFTPEVTENATSSHGATLTPENIIEHQKQFSMFSPVEIVFDRDTETECATYNTSFDLSRQAADPGPVPPKQDSGFGLIGSLKSKLSSIDINKLQNSVTTFFDPAYNTAKTETVERNQPASEPSQGIEIFVPNPETHPQPYNYDAHQSSFTYGQGSIPNASEYYYQQAHNMYSTNSYYSQPNYGTQSYSNMDIPVQQVHNQHSSFVNNLQSSEGAAALPCEPSTSTGYIADSVKDNSTGNAFALREPVTEPLGSVAEHSGETNNNAALWQNQLESDRPETTQSEIEKCVENVLRNFQISDNATANLQEGNRVTVFQDQHEIDTQHEKITKEAVKNVGITRDEIKAKAQQLTFKDVQIPLNFITSQYANKYGELSEKVIRGTSFVDMLDHSKKDEELMRQNRAQLDRIYSASLHVGFDNSAHEISDNVSEGEVSWSSHEDEVDDRSVAERLTTLADADSVSDDECPCAYESEQTEDLNICETCREVNPAEEEDNEEDLTHKLIKNITAPIQLSNPVEAPLTETRPIVPDDFDTINQCAEISLIADETIETLQIQSATELLDDNENTNAETNYGWRTEAPLPPGEDLLDHDYSFETNPNTLGLFGNNTLFFDNLPDYASEMKLESTLAIKPKAAIVLERQMSIPSAPPAEDSDDDKSDETGVLDVLSIEQDASNDFPVFEEFVIEPSEMDDDKLELRNSIDEVKEVKNKSDSVKDTFTNRVDRFKKLEGNDDIPEQQDSNANSNTKMPSYFDTGNYAVDAHFKNSRTSPTISRIPPGFEDFVMTSKDLDEQYKPVKIPDTSTQTNITTTISEVHTGTENRTSTVFSTMVAFTNEPSHVPPQPETQLLDFPSVFEAKKDTNVPYVEKPVEIPTNNPLVNPQAKVEDTLQGETAVILPDPINFFASSTQEADATEGVNRLASYFASPAKTDNTKSFFELSQGQDHYRQKEENDENKTFFESQDYEENISNIPHDQYIANLNLMNDLTSCQNIEPTRDQVVRTVNYFTVEYDNDSLNTLIYNKGEPSLNFKPDINVNKDENMQKEETNTNHDEFTDVVNRCKHCRDLNAGPILTVRETDFDSIGKVKFRQAMDTASTAKEEVNIQPEREAERSVNVRMEDVASDGDNSEGVAMLTENRSTNEYEPVKYHWFYRVDCEDKSTWRGFSSMDSRAIENAFHSPTLNEGTLVPTDGGRYDVNVVGRLRTAVYWSDKPTNVRRCSWFYKGTTDARYVPYTETVAEKLEVEYRHGVTTGEWHRRLTLPNNELVVMHGPAVMVHFLQAGTADAFSAPNLFTFGKRVYRNPPKFKVPDDLPPRVDHLLLLVHGAGEWKHQKEKIQSTMRPRVVRRGIDESEIEDTEPSSIDHLLLLCHGVGSACDMRFRAVEQVVDDFRATSLQLLQSHYRNSYDNGTVGRVEVLPISWHASLHSGPRGVDRRLARVTLASIPRLRSFTNDTVLDVLFYTSPHYCQMILDTVCGELNRIYTLFMSRNPDFKGQVSLGGHSLGSVILYDLLCNQPIPRNPVKLRSEKTYISGTAANNPTMQYPTLCFEPLALYALGSPIAIFECIRGVDMLGSEFYLPTCRNFFNIFHPYDPIAYRIEPLVNAHLQNVKPSLIPHHKGRKRMHLELKDTMARVGADLKQKLVESIRNTWSSMWSSAAPPDHQLEKVVEEEIEKEQLEEESSKEEPMQADVTPGEMLGRLNGGRRVDYVLQEAPFEMINEYLFAMSSHVCYWESEDVMLLILREIYDSMGVQPDVTVPQQSMTVQRTTLVTDNERIVTNSPDASTSGVS